MAIVDERTAVTAGVTRLCDVGVPMRDGTLLSADVYFPAGGVDGGPYPAVVNRTPYDNQGSANLALARHLTAHGYAVVLQDVRGKHDSDGDWLPFRHEGPDGYDTIEWVAEQPWCTARVGTFGISYEGWVQWALAREQPPHLCTMVSTAPGGRFMRELPFHNGVLMLAMLPWLHATSGRTIQLPDLIPDLPVALRHLPVRTMDELLGQRLPVWREWLEHPVVDAYWRELSLDDDFAGIDMPVLHVTGWYDGDQPGALYFYEGMCRDSPRARDQHLLVGPWDHGGTREPAPMLGGVDFGREAVADVADLHRRWYDHWLKAEPSTRFAEPRCRAFQTGGAGWQDLSCWPPPGATDTVLHLRSGGRANTLAGDGRLSFEAPAGAEPPDVYAYDPADPTPSCVDERFYAGDQVETPLDHRFKHRRDDVLVYTSDALPAELVLGGQPLVRLFASTDGSDTDWFATLHDVAPTGASTMLAEGRLRARFRESLEREALLEPGRPYEFTFELSAIFHALAPGHRLRLTVASSDFPTWERNPNTGDPIGSATTIRVATNRVHHEPGMASRLVVPVVAHRSSGRTADEGAFR